MLLTTLGLVMAGIAFVVILTFLAMSFRTVVPTNQVHIVQSGSKTTSFGKDYPKNVYYSWPSWMPAVGVKVIIFPTNVFDQTLAAYDAYDKGRLPFQVDVMAFFRITDSNLAAQRISSFQELLLQLKSILQGSVRTILAQSEIEQILEGRAAFGEMFTAEVDANLKNWGVQTVKHIELMDIRDGKDHKVIANIMAKKQSFIEMQSRTEVAVNNQKAQQAEISAFQAVEVSKQEAQQLVGIKTAEAAQQIGIAEQRSNQAVQEEAKITAEKAMAVKQVNDVRAAEINRNVQVVAADQQKQVTVLAAEGQLQSAKLHAEGVTAEGIAKGNAEQASLMAPVNAQLTLAEKIGANKEYQQYLVTVRQIEASQAIGIEQAKALGHADIKVIANTGNAVDGVTDAMQLFTPKGGLQLGGMLESLANTEAGKAIVARLAGKPNGAATN